MEDELLDIKFPKCPACGSTKFLSETLGEKVKKRGLMRPELECYFEIKQGIVKDDTRVVNMPIGSSLPGYIAYLDICLECGTLSARKIEYKKASMKLPNTIQIPGEVVPRMPGYKQPRGN